MWRPRQPGHHHPERQAHRDRKERSIHHDGGQRRSELPGQAVRPGEEESAPQDRQPEGQGSRPGPVPRRALLPGAGHGHQAGGDAFERLVQAAQGERSIGRQERLLGQERADGEEQDVPAQPDDEPRRKDRPQDIAPERPGAARDPPDDNGLERGHRDELKPGLGVPAGPAGGRDRHRGPRQRKGAEEGEPDPEEAPHDMSGAGKPAGVLSSGATLL